MSRKTPTLDLLVQNADIASPVRRSSRIAQNQKSSAPILTRRASADTNTSETKKSRRLSLSQEPNENSESGRSTPLFVNQESKTPSTRKRKDSTSSSNEGKTSTPARRTSTPLNRRSTRSMSRSPQKSEEILEPTTKSRSKLYSMTEKVKPLEAIKEIETLKECIQHQDENEGRDECDKEVEIASRNLKNVKEAIVILNPITKDKQEPLKKDTEQENNVIFKENGINEPDAQECKVTKGNLENSKNEKNDILDTSTTEKLQDELIENEIDKKKSDSIIKMDEKNNCTESLNKLEITCSNNRNSTCELILSNEKVDNNSSFSEEQSFQFDLNVSMDNDLPNTSTSSCSKKDQENELPESNINNKAEINSKESPKGIATQLNETKTPKQSPKCKMFPIEIENGTLTKTNLLYEPMDVDEYTLLGDLDENIVSPSISNEPKQVNVKDYPTSPSKNEKCIQNIGNNIIKEQANVAETSDDKNKEKLSQNTLVTEDETAENVQLNQDNLNIIPVDDSLIYQNDNEEPTESSNGLISELKKENQEEQSQSIDQIKTKIVDDKDNDFKNNEKTDNSSVPIPTENISIDNEQDNLNHQIPISQVNIDAHLENKVTDLINNKFNHNQEESDSEVDVHSVTDFLAIEAEEGEEEDEDENENNSNDVVDEGESVGYSTADEDEKETDNESYDPSFINDNVSDELLSGNEFDLENDKAENQKNNSKKLEKGEKKWSRIIQADKSDESLSESIKIGENSVSMSNTKEQTTFISDEEDVIESNSALNKSSELQSAEANKPEINTISKLSDEMEISPKKTKKRSSLTISENLSFNEIRERIEEVVDLFSTTVNNSNRKILLNLSLNYESDSDSKDDERKLSTSLQDISSTKKRKKSLRKLNTSSNICTFNEKPKDLELDLKHDESLTKLKVQNDVNDLQPCKSDEIIYETGGSNKNKRRSKNINKEEEEEEEEPLLSSNKSKDKFQEESEDVKSVAKIFNDDLVILNPPKKKKKVECFEQFHDKNFEMNKKIKRRNESGASDGENSELINGGCASKEYVAIMEKEDKKTKKTKVKEHAENIDTELHKKKRKPQFSLENNTSQVDLLLKKSKKQKMLTEDIKKGKSKVKILSNVLIANGKSDDEIKKPKKKHEINLIGDENESKVNIKLSTKEKDKKKKRRNKTEEFANANLNIFPSKDNPKLWIVDNFDTPPKPSQYRKEKVNLKKNNSKELTVSAVKNKDFRNIRLYDSSRINRMETIQLLKKKKKQVNIKSA